MATSADCALETSCRGCVAVKDAFDILICDWCVGNDTCLANNEASLCIDPTTIEDYTECPSELTKDDYTTIFVVTGIIVGLILIGLCYWKIKQSQSHTRRARDAQFARAQARREQELEDIDVDGNVKPHASRNSLRPDRVNASGAQRVDPRLRKKEPDLDAPMMMRPNMRRSFKAQQSSNTPASQRRQPKPKAEMPPPYEAAVSDVQVQLEYPPGDDGTGIVLDAQYILSESDNDE